MICVMGGFVRIFIYISMHICVYSCTYMYLNIRCIYIYIHRDICIIHPDKSAQLSGYLYIYLYIYIYTSIYIYINIYIYLYIYIYIYRQIPVNMYIVTSYIYISTDTYIYTLSLAETTLYKTLCAARNSQESARSKFDCIELLAV